MDFEEARKRPRFWFVVALTAGDAGQTGIAVFGGFASQVVRVNGIDIHCRHAGDGPPLLLLHGHPQTHVIWHRIASSLAENFSVVAADLRGYGYSERPPYSSNSENYSKRTMAQDQVELMRALGHDRFSIVAHDRGARVAHRMAADHPDRVKKMMLLDIAPTLAMYEQTNEAFARAYWHWFFLIQPAPFPEVSIDADPGAYLTAVMGARSENLGLFTEAALGEYLRCLSLPGSSVAICEDYRASAGIDLEHDRQDRETERMINCPVRVLWGADGVVAQYFDPLNEWRKVASDISGRSLQCGHYIPEQAPEQLLHEIHDFFSQMQ